MLFRAHKKTKKKKIIQKWSRSVTYNGSIGFKPNTDDFDIAINGDFLVQRSKHCHYDA
jgi:hypothetical protein